jgi:superoxide dismutase, Fe-Mn family
MSLFLRSARILSRATRTAVQRQSRACLSTLSRGPIISAADTTTTPPTAADTKGKRKLPKINIRKLAVPDLPYEYSALEPVISGKIMELHHSKHHAAYVNNYNASLQKAAEAALSGNINSIFELESAIKFNLGGHINHSLFWASLAPPSNGGGGEPEGALADAINETFGSFENFKTAFNIKTAAVQGAGWGWLVKVRGTNNLGLMTTANQDMVKGNLVPLLGIDVWEHAYYLDYLNARPDYLNEIWKVVNWSYVSDRFEKF